MPSERVADVEYQTGAHTWKVGPKRSTLWRASSVAEQKGYHGFKATFADGRSYWFCLLADGWNRMAWNA